MLFHSCIALLKLLNRADQAQITTCLIRKLLLNNDYCPGEMLAFLVCSMYGGLFATHKWQRRETKDVVVRQSRRVAIVAIPLAR